MSKKPHSLFFRILQSGGAVLAGSIFCGLASVAYFETELAAQGLDLGYGIVESTDSAEAVRMDRLGTIHRLPGSAFRPKPFVVASDAQRTFSVEGGSSIRETALAPGYPEGVYSLPGSAPGEIKAMAEHPGGDRLLIVVEDGSGALPDVSRDIDRGLQLSPDFESTARRARIVSLNISAEIPEDNVSPNREFSEVRILEGGAYNITDMVVSPQGDLVLITAKGISDARATPFGVISGPDDLTGGIFVVDPDSLETIDFLPTSLTGEDTREVRQALVETGNRIKHPVVHVAALNELTSAASLAVGLSTPGSGVAVGGTLSAQYLNNHFIHQLLAESYEDFGFLAAYALTYPHDMIGATGIGISNRGDLAMVAMEKTNNVGVIPLNALTSPLGDISFDSSDLGFGSASPKSVNGEHLDFSLNGSGGSTSNRFSFWGPSDLVFSSDDGRVLIGAYGGSGNRYGTVDLDQNRDLVSAAHPTKNFIALERSSLRFPKHVAAEPAIDNDGDGLSNHTEAFNRWNDGRDIPFGVPGALAGARSGRADINIPAKSVVNGSGGQTAFYLLPHSGIGYRFDYIGNEKFFINTGSLATVAGIEQLGFTWQEASPGRPYFIVQAMAHAGGGNLYNRSGEIQDYSSRTGFDANIAYFSQGSDEPFDVVASNGPESPRDNRLASLRGMDQAATRKLIEVLLAEPMVKEVWIDPLVYDWFSEEDSKFVVRGDSSPSSQERRDCDTFMKVVFGGESAVQVLIDNASKIKTDDGFEYYYEALQDLAGSDAVPVTFLVTHPDAVEFRFGSGDQLYYDEPKKMS